MDNRKVKICHVASADMAVAFLLLNQLKFLKDEEYDVCVVCPTGKHIKAIEGNGIKVKPVNFNRGLNPFVHFITLIKLFVYFKKEKFDIVHTHNPVPGLLGQLAAKFAGVPIIINTIHGFYFTEDSSLLKRKFFVFLEKIEARCSDLIFSQNKEDIGTAIRERICRPSKIKYLGNGVNLERFDSDRFSEVFINEKKKSLGLNINQKVVGMIGRLVEEKGYLDLFAAFKIVLNKIPNALLLIIGPEEFCKKERINKKVVTEYGIGKNVLFLGERLDVDELYPLMDIFVLPSHREGFPRTIIEAMASQRPIIATDIRGCREAIHNGKNGVLVPPKNSLVLAEQIIYLLEDKELATQMAKGARRRVEKEFDERLVFDRISKEYQELINKKYDLFS